MKRKISHSEITTYLDCQKKWKLQYVDNIKLSSPHLEFGEMAHKVLETNTIPDESLYSNLKEYFKIDNWATYFNRVLSELKDFTKDYEVFARELKLENEYLVGVIDLILKRDNTYIICDYKFSNNIKNEVDLFLDEQLNIYAVLFSQRYNVPLENIKICYINIPKVNVGSPKILSSGKLSKDKNQNTTYDEYLFYIDKLGLNKEDYSDILDILKDKKMIKIYYNTINVERVKNIFGNIDNVIKDMDKGYILEHENYMCKNCPYVSVCKRIKL